MNYFTPKPSRRAALAFMGALMCSASLMAQATERGVLRIGYQKSSALMTVLKTKGTLEPLLSAKGIKITWH